MAPEKVYNTVVFASGSRLTIPKDSVPTSGNILAGELYYNPAGPTLLLGVNSTTFVTIGALYTDENAQDAVGTILTSSASVGLAYSDSTPSITATVIPAGVSHNALSNLTTGDVHTQYVLKDGRAGGQTIIGGTADSNNLTLQATTVGFDPGDVIIDARGLVVDEIGPYTEAFVGLYGVKINYAAILIEEAPGTIEAVSYIRTHAYFQAMGGSSSSLFADGVITRDVATPTTFNFNNPTSTLELQVEGNKVFHTGNDGAGSLFDSDLLDGHEGVFYQDAANLTAGSLPFARIQFSAASLLFGRGAGSGAGAGQEIALGTGLLLTGTTLSVSGTFGHTIQDEGTGLTARTGLNFVGAGVTATDDSGNNRTVVTIPGAGHTIQDDGSPFTARANLNFIGVGVAVSDDAGNDATLVTIPGAGSGSAIVGSGPSTGGTVTYNNAASVDLVPSSDDGKMRFTLFNGSAWQQFTGTSTKNASLASSGAGGLDTGSEAASTFYHLFAIGKADGTLAIMLSVSATTPTMPTGYTFKGLIGGVANDASSNIVTFQQLSDSRFMFTSAQVDNVRGVNVLNNGSATSYTAIDLSKAVPDIPGCVYGLQFRAGNANSTSSVVSISENSGGTQQIMTSRTIGHVTGAVNAEHWEIECRNTGNRATSVYYKWSVSTADIDVDAYVKWFILGGEGGEGAGLDGHTIQDEGTPVATRANLNFVGSGVAVTDDSGNDATVVTITTGAGSGHTIQDEGTPLTARTGLNFIGASVSVADDSGNNRTNVTITSTGHTIQEEGSGLTARTGLNFVGAGVAATDDSGNDRTIVTIPGAHVVQDEGSNQTQRSKINFIGDGVTVTDDSGNDRTNVTITTGGAGSVGKYTHTQGSTSTTWTVTHGLDTNDFALTIYDNSSPPNLVDPDSVTITDTNHVTLTFAVAMAGKAVFVGGTGGQGAVSPHSWMLLMLTGNQ